MAATSYKRRALAALLCLLALAMAVSPAVGSAKDTKRPREQTISLLYVVNAKGATLIPQGGSKTHYRLALKRPQHDLTWFSDRPERKSGSFPAGSLIRHWAGFGFDSDPPNVAIDYVDSQERNRTAIVELTEPRLLKGKFVFAARLLRPAVVTGENLASHADAADATPPRRLREVALFVDDTKGQVWDGCVLQPYTDCSEAQLATANLYEVDLSGADLSRAGLGGYMEFVNFSGANLTEAVFGQGYASHSNFNGANLSGGATIEAGFFNTTMIGADLSNFRFFQGIVENSNLRGAKYTNLFAIETRFCNTTMFDGSISTTAQCDIVPRFPG